MQELNIINENDEIVGTDTRENIHKHGVLHREIHVWIFNDKGEVVLQKRSAEKETYPGLWDVSVGGHVEIGDSYEDTAIKEVEEETGLKIKKEDLIFLDKVLRRAVDEKTGKKNNAFRSIYAYRYNGSAGALRIEEGKATKLEFWPMEKIYNLGDDEKKDFIPAMVNGNNLEIFKKIESLMKKYGNKS